MNKPEIITETIDLCYCKEEGYYFQNYGQRGYSRESQTFKTKAKAYHAFNLGQLEWSDWH